MLMSVPNHIPLGTEPWKGEYYYACKAFVKDNAAEISVNAPDLDVEQLLKAQAAIYWNGTKLWRKAMDAKREMLNESS